MAPAVGSKRSKGHSIEEEIAQLRGLDLRGLFARWKIVFRKAAPPYLPKHLLFGVLAYQLQANTFGDVEVVTQRTLDQSAGLKIQAEVVKRLQTLDRLKATPEAGTTLVREWMGRKHRVTALSDGFAWNGKTYNSLSAVAVAITGTRWNGTRFFGLRDVRSAK